MKAFLNFPAAHATASCSVAAPHHGRPQTHQTPEVSRVYWRRSPRFRCVTEPSSSSVSTPAFRATELVSLNAGDVWHAGRLRANVTVARRRLKGGRRKGVTSRTVPLNDAAMAALQNYLFSRFGSGPVAPDEPLFPSRFHGMRLTRWRFNSLVQEDRAGVGGPGRYERPALRRTFAKEIYAATGNDINLTRAVLGHAHVSTTQHYLEVDAEEVTRTILSVGVR